MSDDEYGLELTINGVSMPVGYIKLTLEETKPTCCYVPPEPVVFTVQCDQAEPQQLLFGQLADEVTNTPNLIGGISAKRLGEILGG